jgi:hypothetical protein
MDTKLEITDSGALRYDGTIVGRYEAGKLTLDLGWTAGAGLHLVVKADPTRDHKRGNVMLDRPPDRV